jgi:hypothetical protein
LPIKSLIGAKNFAHTAFLLKRLLDGRFGYKNYQIDYQAKVMKMQASRSIATKSH